MNEPFEQNTSPSFDPGSSPVALWTPRAISVITFLLGFPGGATMAILNWLRMGYKKKAYVHIIGFLVIVLGLIPAFLFLTEGSGRYMSFAINIGTMLYLSTNMTNDIAYFKNTHPRVEDRHWASGVLIGLAALAVFFGASFCMILALAGIGLPIAE